MIAPGIMTSLVAISTLCTVIYIGLGFLPRPSPAAAVWSLAFTGVMVSGYAWVAAEATDSAVGRAFASGVMVGFLGIVWLGLCVDRGRGIRTWWPALVWLVAAPLWLSLTAHSDGYLTVVRVSFAVGGVFCALILVELIRRGPRLRDEVLPLALISAAYVLLTVVGLFQEVVRLVTGGTSAPALDDARDLNVLSSQLFVICAAFTLLLLTRQAGSPSAAGAALSFRAVALDRLARAEAGGDRWWSVLVIRLDDPDALRLASSTNAFDHVADRFRRAVRLSLPAEADLEVRGDADCVVLLPRPEGAVRQVLTALLEDVAAIGGDSPIGVRPSASVGWAQVDVVGYDLDALIEAADAASLRAQGLGGDRWDRVVAPVG
ncbi:hypothetical protein N3K63_02030 [Microbacterium sp. W1N]|uniref:hypothetical protein n=1 Tax=Microbacterium festucae TaxID=2977531 RepID=UPI0021C11016|nr:hypothetical protein [Microbacterium festucae]MCT9819059.1 hypothetical protein [Microbacterium festucae]